jgi:hypothetical protein
MSVTSLSDLSRQQMLSILGYSSANQTSKSNNHASSSSGVANANLSSPFAQMLSELQQIEQANPNQYAKVSQQISTNLATAASSAQVRGNSSLALQLTTLSKDFATASKTGQLPSVADLANAMHAGGGAPQNAAVALGSDAAATNAAQPTSGSHSSALKIIGQVLSLAGI